MRICPQCHQLTQATLCAADGFVTVEWEEDPAHGEDPLVGRVFQGRYRIEAVLGRGGMGTVYKATQLTVNRAVALKILRPRLEGDLKAIARFQQEARTIASLSHPNAVKLIDFGQSDDEEQTFFLVMEHLEGSSLREVISSEAPLSPERVRHISIQILEVLGEAHHLNVIHRDLKPANIFLCAVAGSPDFVKVLDFGVAKVSGVNAADTTLTGSDAVLGSPRYMAPEQAQGQPVTPQSDLYSLGLIMHEMLTGAPVFSCKTPAEYVLAHVREIPPFPAIDDIQLVDPLVDMVMRCINKSCGDRPEGADEMRRTLLSLETRDTPARENARTSTRGTPPLSGHSHGTTTKTAPGRPLKKPGQGWLRACLSVSTIALVALGIWRASGDEPSPVEVAAPPHSVPAVAITPETITPHVPEALPEAMPVAVDTTAPPAPQLGVDLQTVPPGAEVWRGDISIGKTPTHITWNADEDTPTFSIKHAGYREQDWTPQKEDVEHGVTLKLKRARKPKTRAPYREI